MKQKKLRASLELFSRSNEQKQDEQFIHLTKNFTATTRATSLDKGLSSSASLHISMSFFAKKDRHDEL